MKDFDYIAFISYRHKPLDRRIAVKIQKSIEDFTLPSELRGENENKKLGRVFRDDDELPLSPDLSESILNALDRSKFLIVICTPDLPVSSWCEQEIRYFLTTHDRNHVLTVLADGKPEDSFSPLLLHTYDEEGNITGDLEPLGANFTEKRSVRKETVRIIAALAGCSFDTLWQREKRARMTRIAVLTGISMVILAVFLGVVISKNAQISGKNEEITAKNQRLQQQMSTTLVDQGFNLVKEGDMGGALESALQSFPEEKDLHDHRVEPLLVQALGAYRYQDCTSRMINRQVTEIVTAGVSADKQYALVVDKAGTVRCISLQDGAEKWACWTLNAEQADKTNETSFFFPEGTDIVLCKNTCMIKALSVQDGSVLWSYLYKCGNSFETGNNFAVLSPDGTRLALMDSHETHGKPEQLIVLDTRTGETVGTVDLHDDSLKVDLGSKRNWYYGGGSFAEDGETLVIALYERETEPEDSLKSLRCVCHLISTLSWEEVHSGAVTGLQPGACQILYCADYFPETQCLFVAMFSGEELVTSVFNYQDMTSTMERIHHHLPTDDGINYNLPDVYSVLPALVFDETVIVFSEDSIFQFDRRDGKLITSFRMTGKILNAWSVDREKQQAAFVMSDGRFGVCDFSHREDTIFHGNIDGIDRDDLLFAYPLGSPEEMNFLTIPKKAHEIMITRSMTDPGYSTVDLRENAVIKGRYFSVYPVPGNDSQVFLFCPLVSYTNSETELIVRKEDLQTRKVLAEASLLVSGNLSYAPLDSDHVIIGSTVFSMNGESSPLPGTEETEAYRTNMISTLLPDGTVLTEAVRGELSGRCWVNGQPVAGGEDNTGIGTWDLAGRLMIARQDGCFVVFDPMKGTREEIPDRLADLLVTSLAQGTQKTVFACAYSDGQVFLYDPADGAAHAVPGSYARSEIQALAFTEKDQKLLVLTASGRIDIYNTGSNELVVSLQTKLENSLSGKSVMQCREDQKRHRLHIFARKEDSNTGTWICLDTDAWIVTASVEEANDWLPADNCLYRIYLGSLVRCPVYSLEELTAWAEKTI